MVGITSPREPRHHRRHSQRRYVPLIFLILVGATFGVVVYHYFGHRSAKQVATQSVSQDQMAETPAPVSSQTQPKASCDSGYILVPGNPTLYQTSDFCVMKYDAKCAFMTDLTTGIKPKPGDPAYGTSGGNPEGVYKNSAVGSACTGVNNRRVVSTASGSPITFIPGNDTTTNNATAYCAGIGSHLITNNEWMTIARNVEQITANWCDTNGTNCGAPPGTPGKILANGHNDDQNEPAASFDGNGALIAASDDQPCYGTTTDGSNRCGGKSSQKRTLTLSNGQVIWDLAGNVWQWTATTVARKDEPASTSKGVLDIAWTRSDFAPGSLPSVITDNGKGPTLGYDAFRPSNPSWNANQGVGRIYHYSSRSDTDTTQYDFLRGGNWRHYSDDGAFTIHLSPPITKGGIDDVGFRCVRSKMS